MSAQQGLASMGGNGELQEFSRTVFEALHAVPQEKIDEALGKAKIDPAVGLAVSPLDVERVTFEDLVYKTAAARIVPLTSSGERPCITPHYHEKGFDFVVFLKQTEVNLGQLTADNTGVEWDEPVIMNPGDELRLDVRRVHSWRAMLENESDFIFCCPDEHLQDNSLENPRGDRYIVKGLKNGVPPHYSQS